MGVGKGRGVSSGGEGGGREGEPRDSSRGSVVAFAPVGPPRSGGRGTRRRRTRLAAGAVGGVGAVEAAVGHTRRPRSGHTHTPRTTHTHPIPVLLSRTHTGRTHTHTHTHTSPRSSSVSGPHPGPKVVSTHTHTRAHTRQGPSTRAVANRSPARRLRGDGPGRRPILLAPVVARAVAKVGFGASLTTTTASGAEEDGARRTGNEDEKGKGRESIASWFNRSEPEARGDGSGESPGS